MQNLQFVITYYGQRNFEKKFTNLDQRSRGEREKIRSLGSL